MEEIAKHVVEKTFKERKERGEFTGRYGPQDKKSKIIEQKELDLFYYMKK